MTPLIVSAQDQIDQVLTKFLSHRTPNYQLLYIGADWCAPCKALKPVLISALKQRNEIQAYELKLNEQLDLVGSRMVTALPCVLLTHNGEIISELQGMVESKELEALLQLIPLKTPQSDRLASHIHTDSNHQEEVVIKIRGLLILKNVQQAKAVYQALSSSVKFQPRMQQVKILVDLVELSLGQSKDGNPCIKAACSFFTELDIYRGLECLTSTVIQGQDPLAKQLYILAVNTLADRNKAAYYRRNFLKPKP